jgi:hypothetical protein
MALTEGRTITIGAPNPEGWGPWVGVPKERQSVCAFKDCTRRGGPKICPYDGRYHHHGCIHYDLKDERMRDGWCWLCQPHYDELVAEVEAKRKARAA